MRGHDSKTTIVGITGGIATGKSTLLGIFRGMGVPTIDSDRIVHGLLRRGTKVFSAVVASFGRSYLSAGGCLDRRKLGEMVFRNRVARRRLERIVHPAVFTEIARQIGMYRRRHSPVVAVDIPLLFEARATIAIDMIVVAYAPPAIQIRRLRARGLGAQAARARIRAQWSIEYKRRRADIVFDMRSPIRRIRQEVRSCFHSLTK